MPPVNLPDAALDGARTDSVVARERLLHSGLRLFAQQGFTKTSTRELAEAAGVNVASISYYFGDKAGLYRAVFMEPLGPRAAAWRASTSRGWDYRRRCNGCMRAFSNR